MVLVLFLLCIALLVLRQGVSFWGLPCSFVLVFVCCCFFIPFSIVIIERACMCASRAFVAFFARVVFVLLLSSWCEGLAALMTVALPWLLFSFLFHCFTWSNILLLRKYCSKQHSVARFEISIKVSVKIDPLGHTECIKEPGVITSVNNSGFWNTAHGSLAQTVQQSLVGTPICYD